MPVPREKRRQQAATGHRSDCPDLLKDPELVEAAHGAKMKQRRAEAAARQAQRDAFPIGRGEVRPRRVWRQRHVRPCRTARDRRADVLFR